MSQSTQPPERIRRARPVPELGHYEIHAKQQWTDPEPDTLTIKLVTARDGNGPFITFSGNETFLTLSEAQEVIDFLRRSILEGSLIQLDRGMTPTWSDVNGRKMG